MSNQYGQIPKMISVFAEAPSGGGGGGLCSLDP